MAYYVTYNFFISLQSVPACVAGYQDILVLFHYGCLSGLLALRTMEFGSFKMWLQDNGLQMDADGETKFRTWISGVVAKPSEGCYSLGHMSFDPTTQAGWRNVSIRAVLTKVEGMLEEQAWHPQNNEVLWLPENASGFCYVSGHHRVLSLVALAQYVQHLGLDPLSWLREMMTNIRGQVATEVKTLSDAFVMGLSICIKREINTVAWSYITVCTSLNAGRMKHEDGPCQYRAQDPSVHFIPMYVATYRFIFLTNWQEFVREMDRLGGAQVGKVLNYKLLHQICDRVKPRTLALLRDWQAWKQFFLTSSCSDGTRIEPV